MRAVVTGRSAVVTTVRVAPMRVAGTAPSVPTVTARSAVVTTARVAPMRVAGTAPSARTVTGLPATLTGTACARMTGEIGVTTTAARRLADRSGRIVTTTPTIAVGWSAPPVSYTHL